MTFIFYKLIGSLIVPPGIFCAALLLCALRAYKPPRKKILSMCLILLSAMLWFMSTALGAALITGPLEGKYPRCLPEGEGPYTVLVLSGGSSYDAGGKAVQPGAYTLERIYCAVNLVKKYGGTLLLSGGNVYGTGEKSEAEIMADCARNLGWNGRILLEKKSRTTKENLLMSAGILKAEHIRGVVIVTNAFHMPRTMLYASRMIPSDINVYPYASGRAVDPVFKGLPSLIPENVRFFHSSLGIKEWIGMAAAQIF